MPNGIKSFIEWNPPAALTGPRGGNLNNPDQSPECRKAHNTATMTESGPSLHRFLKQDSAAAGLKDEKPWHHMAAYMLNMGRTNSEIAAAAGVQPGQVAILKAQVWFIELCATIANEEGGELLGMLRAEAAASINRIVEIRDDEEAGPRTRLAAAQIILEQAHGKPVQKILTSKANPNKLSPQEELDQIDQELAALQKMRT